MKQRQKLLKSETLDWSYKNTQMISAVQEHSKDVKEECHLYI